MFQRIRSIRNSFRRKSVNKQTRGSLIENINQGPLPRLLALIIFISFLGFLILPVIVETVRFRLKEFPSADRETVYWQKDERLHVLLLGLDKPDEQHIFVDAITVLIMDPEDRQIGLINVNPDITVNINNDGNYVHLRTIFNNSEYRDEELAGILSGVESLLAIPIQRYMVVDGMGFEKIAGYLNNVRIDLLKVVEDEDVVLKTGEDYSWDEGAQVIENTDYYEFVISDNNGRDDQLQRQLELYSEVIQNIEPLQLFLRYKNYLRAISDNIYTDFSEIEFFYFCYRLLSLKQEQPRIAYTKNSVLINDGKIGVYDKFFVNYYQLDEDLEQVLLKESLANERILVEVLNGTNIAGLAGSKARLLSNGSISVAHIGNSPVEYQRTTVFLDQDKVGSSETVAEIRRIFPQAAIKAIGNYKYKAIGEIVVIIGNDLIVK